MKVYVLGNRDISIDNIAYKVAKKLEGKIPNVRFVIVKPNEDLPLVDQRNVIILDVVQGIKEVTLIDEDNLAKLVISKSVTAHDYDLGFQLKYLKKLGRLSKVTVIGLPIQGKIDYFFIQSILRKLVAQDIQGS